MTATATSGKVRIELRDARGGGGAPASERPLLEIRWIIPPQTGDRLTLRDGAAVVVLRCRLEDDDQTGAWFTAQVGVDHGAGG